MITKNYIHSSVHNYYLCLPMKTSSRTIGWIFRYFNFQNYTRFFSETNNFFDHINDWTITHTDYIPPESSNHKIIMSARNPYDRVLSLFIHTWKPGKLIQPQPQDFTVFLEQMEDTRYRAHLDLGINLNADYIVKTENIFNDLIQIPFISTSDLYTTGILQNMCNQVLNPMKYTIQKNDFLTQLNKDIIYDLFGNHFTKFGYLR